MNYYIWVREFNRLISPEQNNTLTQTLYQKIPLRRLIQHTYQIIRTYVPYSDARREHKSSMSSFQLLEWVLYYQISIANLRQAVCNSIVFYMHTMRN